MADLNSSICISSVAASALAVSGIDVPENIEKPNKLITALAEKKLGGKKADRVVLYNPDAVALWVYQKYTDMFTDAALCSDLALPMLSVMPSVTPVCFASMYSGVMPDIHGIKKYEKPVLTVETLFDWFAAAGKKAQMFGCAFTFVFYKIGGVSYFLSQIDLKLDAASLARRLNAVFQLLYFLSASRRGVNDKIIFHKYHIFLPRLRNTIRSLGGRALFVLRYVVSLSSSSSS